MTLREEDPRVSTPVTHLFFVGAQNGEARIRLRRDRASLSLCCDLSLHVKASQAGLLPLCTLLSMCCDPTQPHIHAGADAQARGAWSSSLLRCLHHNKQSKCKAADSPLCIQSRLRGDGGRTAEETHRGPAGGEGGSQRVTLIPGQPLL